MRRQTLYTSDAGFQPWNGPPPPMQALLTCHSVLSCRIDGDAFRGRVFVLDKPHMTTDDLALAGIVARQIAADLGQFYVQQRLLQATVAEERVHLARELHDGVLQSLAGIALQLQAVHGLLQTRLEPARARIAEIGNLVAAEQRDLRFFIQQLKPLPLDSGDVNGALIAQLRGLGERAEQQWGIKVELTAARLSRPLSETLAHATYRMIQEALANAARHGPAKVVHIRLEIQGEHLRITVADDGRGFSFKGRYGPDALAATDGGPASLKERIASLNGKLTIESGRSGARLEIALPLELGLRLVPSAHTKPGAGDPPVEAA